MRIIALIAFSFLTLTNNVFAGSNQSVGLKEIKGIMNKIQFASAKLTRFEDRVAQRLEREAMNSRGVHIDQVTEYDSLIEAVKFNDNSVFLNLKF